MICRGTRGRGLHPRKSSRAPPQEVNGRVSYFLHERFFCFAQQESLSLTPPSARRKRQASCYRSGHLFSFAGDGLPFRSMATTPKKRSNKSKVTRTASRVESFSQLKKTLANQEKLIATQERELHQAAEQQTGTREA